MDGYYCNKIGQFLAADTDGIANQLSARLIEHYRGDHERQLYSWRRQVRLLQEVLSGHLETDPTACEWG